MHSLSPTPGQTLRCQMKKEHKHFKVAVTQVTQSRLIWECFSHIELELPEALVQKLQNGSKSRHHILTVRPAAPGDGGAHIVRWTRHTGLWAQREAAGDKWGGHFGGGGSPSFTDSKLHMKLLSGCFLRVYLFKGHHYHSYQ